MRFGFYKRGYEIWHCDACGLGMTDLQRSYRPFITNFYNKRYFTGGDECGAYEDYEKDKPLEVRNLSAMLDACGEPVKGGRLLDVGCAMGYCIAEAMGRGWDSYGIDVSSYAISRADAAIKPRIRIATIGEMKFPKEYFDRITMLDVLEHLKDPRRDLMRLRSFLTDTGRLVIATGDSSSVFARLMGSHWMFYNPPQHLFFFNRPTLTRLLQESGYEPIRWFSVGKWLGLGYILHLAVTTGDFRWISFLDKAIKKTRFNRVPIYVPVLDNIVVEAKKK